MSMAPGPRIDTLRPGRSRGKLSHSVAAMGRYGAAPKKKALTISRKCLILFSNLVRPAGFEPTTPWFVESDSDAGKA